MAKGKFELEIAKAGLNPASNNSTPPAPAPKLRIAIVGAGLAGLVCAALLSKPGDIAVDVYERNPEIRAVGAGIAFWKRVWSVLNRELGIDEACAKLNATDPGGWAKAHNAGTFKGDDQDANLEPIRVFEHPFKFYARPGLLAALAAMLNPELCHVCTGYGLEDYSIKPDGTVRMTFNNAETRECDLLIGADGVFSTVRARMYTSMPDYKRAQFSGQYCYRLIYAVKDIEVMGGFPQVLRGSNVFVGKHRHIFTYRIGNNVLISAYDKTPSGESPEKARRVIQACDPAHIASLYADWNPAITDLFKLTPVPDQYGNVATRWAINTVPQLPSFVDGPVVLIGDAAHAMLPHQGQGGGQGVEDAYVLYQLLKHPLANKQNVGMVGKVYDAIRRPMMDTIIPGCDTAGQMFDLEHDSFSGKPLEEIGASLFKLAKWVEEEGSCDTIAEQAVHQFKGLCSDTK